MISTAQIRAARALLNWTQQDVIRAINITPATLSRLEGGLAQGRASTLNKLETLFSQAGIEFLSGNGVRMRQRLVTIEELIGDDAITTMQNDMHATTLTSPERVMYLNGIDERQFIQSDATHLLTFQKRLRDSKLRQHILVKNNDHFFVMPPEVAEYRWVAPELFGHIPFIIYGNKVAILFWGPPTQVIVMESEPLAETYRKQFKALWQNATAVPFTDKEIREICNDNFT